MVEAGATHSLAIKKDGTLWAWGQNNYGQLGVGMSGDIWKPTQVGTNNDWVAISAGHVFSAAIKNDGTLWTWGFNGNGSLGDGTNTNKLSPTQVGVSKNWVKIAGGSEHLLAIKNDSSLWATGWNQYGQLGIGTTKDTNQITRVGTDNNWQDIAAGGVHSIALKSNGSFWGWGYNLGGELGNGTMLSTTIPVLVKDCIIAVEIKQIQKTKSLTLFPNPTTNILYFNQPIMTVEIYCIDGRKVSNFSNCTQIDVSKLSDGLYFCKGIDRNENVFIEQFQKN